jgi:hypothetical protein
MRRFDDLSHDALPATFCSLRWRYMQCDVGHGQVKACCKTPFL